jgi:hypothetical protein
MPEGEELVEAARANDFETVSRIANQYPELLRRRGSAGTTALAAAIATANVAIVDYLLRKEVKLDIFTASALGRSVDVHSMLAADHDAAWRFSDEGFTALHLGARYGHQEVVALLIRAISDVHAKSRDAAKATPLHLAAANGHVRVAQQLLAAGADINAKDGAGKTPVGVAMAAGQSEMVAYLEANGGVEVVVAAPAKAAAAAAPAAGTAPAPAAEGVNPLTGKPVKATERAIDAINKSRAKRGLPPLSKPSAVAAPAATAGVAAAEGVSPETGKPTAATERALAAINRSREKRGLPPLPGPGGATPTAEPVAATAAPAAAIPEAAAGDRPTAAADRAAAAIARSRAKREAAAAAAAQAAAGNPLAAAPAPEAVKNEAAQAAEPGAPTDEAPAGEV